MPDHHEIAGDGLRAVVSSFGAELVSLRDAADEELLWQAGPQWPRHAPILFPIVGRLGGDRLRHDGRTYHMTQHGLARDSLFEWIERSADVAALRLRDSAETRQSFPFPFVLDVSFAACAGNLTVTACVTNPGEGPLPFSIGAHPAFRWPLVGAVEKTGHVLVFDAPEKGPARSVRDGLLGAEIPLPFDGRELALSDDLFAEDAIVLPDVASRSVRYEARRTDGSVVRSITVGWAGYKDLGIWSKPTGAPFLCIEPWFGMASPIGWDGEFGDKPGILVLPAGESRRFAWTVTLDG